MNVYLKTPEIEINILGKVPGKVLKVLQETYGEDLFISGDDAPYQDQKWFDEVKVTMSVGELVRVYRKLANISQAKLGKLIGGKSRQFISAIENGHREIPIETAKALGKALNRPHTRFLKSGEEGLDNEFVLSQDEIDEMLAVGEFDPFEEIKPELFKQIGETLIHPDENDKQNDSDD